MTNAQSIVNEFKFLKKNQKGTGASGSYYKVNRSVGIKMYYNKYDSKKEAKESWAYSTALQASKVSNIAAKLKIGPKSYGVAIKKRSDGYYVCHVMQHISGVHPSDYGKWYDKVRTKLDKSGLRYTDLHSHNVIKHRSTGKIYVIDMDHVTYRKPRKKKK